MFTGIVEETGLVEGIRPTDAAIELTVHAKICARGVKDGASVAVNGCCLTVIKAVEKEKGKGKSLTFELLAESWNRTNIHTVQVGALVNLERPMRPSGEFGGHFVTGHVDGVGKILRWERVGKDYMLDVAAPPEIMRYVVFKGSIALDGISLTVAAVQPDSFRLWIIPHTYEITVLKERKVGDLVNLEGDLLGKYVERFMSLKETAK